MNFGCWQIHLFAGPLRSGFCFSAVKARDIGSGAAGWPTCLLSWPPVSLSGRSTAITSQRTGLK